MSQTNHRPDALDELLSDYFKTQVPHPWPAAPSATAEPSGLVAARSRAASSGSRARLTLAASVALLLGTCWLMSGGGQDGGHNPAKPVPGGSGGFIEQGTAKQIDPLNKGREKAKTTNDPMTGFKPGPIDLP